MGNPKLIICSRAALIVCFIFTIATACPEGQKPSGPPITGSDGSAVCPLGQEEYDGMCCYSEGLDEDPLSFQPCPSGQEPSGPAALIRGKAYCSPGQEAHNGMCCQAAA